VRNLVDIASKGGNYLLNIGPTSEGLMPAPSVERLKEVGKWMKVNSEAIYGTTASPFKRLSWGRCTKKVSGPDATLYLHIFQWPQNGKLVVPGLTNKPEKVFLLADKSKKALPFERAADSLAVTVPATAPDPISSTVVVRIKGPLVIEQPGLEQAADGTVNLPASEARLHGDQIQYESGERRDNIGFWMNPDEWVDWNVAIKQPGKFEVTAEFAGPSATSVQVTVGSESLTARTPATGDYGEFRSLKIGDATISSPGKVNVKLKGVKEGWQPVNVKDIRLKPIKQ
jgi:alpha-L-fucosidase